MQQAPPLAEQFRAEWARNYGAVLPLGWQLRLYNARPWVRFHALPLSKRYADSDVERATILCRANSLADDILGRGTSCWVVEARAEGDQKTGNFWIASAEDDDPDSPLWHFYIRCEDWRSGKYDAELLAIADDQPNRAIWMRRDNGALFAPYDGGFDLFPPTWQDVERLRERWRDWLSDHPEGL
jgi:hypothetical protein